VLIEVTGHATQVAFEFRHDLRNDVLREPGTNTRQGFQALVQDLPGGLAVGEDEERRAHDLEGGAGSVTRK
jgi:hypothetical protein